MWGFLKKLTAEGKFMHQLQEALKHIFYDSVANEITAMTHGRVKIGESGHEHSTPGSEPGEELSSKTGFGWEDNAAALQAIVADALVKQPELQVKLAERLDQLNRFQLFRTRLIITQYPNLAARAAVLESWAKTDDLAWPATAKLAGITQVSILEFVVILVTKHMSPERRSEFWSALKAKDQKVAEKLACYVNLSDRPVDDILPPMPRRSSVRRESFFRRRWKTVLFMTLGIPSAIVIPILILIMMGS